MCVNRILEEYLSSIRDKTDGSFPFEKSCSTLDFGEQYGLNERVMKVVRNIGKSNSQVCVLTEQEEGLRPPFIFNLLSQNVKSVRI